MVRPAAPSEAFCADAQPLVRRFPGLANPTAGRMPTLLPPLLYQNDISGLSVPRNPESQHPPSVRIIGDLLVLRATAGVSKHGR
jgi:hypothetical protein